MRLENNRVLRCELRRSVLRYVEIRHATSSEHARDATGETDEAACRTNGSLDSLRSVMARVTSQSFAVLEFAGRRLGTPAISWYIDSFYRQLRFPESVKQIKVTR